MKPRSWLLPVGALALAALAAVVMFGGSQAAPTPGNAARGAYVFAASGGCGCHGVNLAGYGPGGPPYGETFNGPFGSIPASNITSDKTTGVGAWTDAQLIAAIRDGIDDEGNRLHPIMPYMTYHFMSDADVTDLVAFLRTVPAVSNQVPERQLAGPIPPAPQLPPSPASAPTGGIARGRYLATAVGDCGSCHTPTTAEGAPDNARLLAGSIIPREGGTFEVGPNITPSLATGIGDWTAAQIVTYLKQGIGPNGRTADGLMGEVVAGGFRGLGLNQLTDADALTMATWLKSIPAVNNVPRAPRPAASAASSAAVGSWDANFQAAHGRLPNDKDRADRAWSLNFQATTGHPPTDADWMAHWQATGQ